MRTSNPELYRQMSEPKESLKAAKGDILAFFNDVAELRKKHKIRDILCMCQVTVKYEDGSEGEPIVYSHWGDTTKAPILAQVATIKAKQDVDEMIEKLSK